MGEQKLFLAFDNNRKRLICCLWICVLFLAANVIPCLSQELELFLLPLRFLQFRMLIQLGFICHRIRELGKWFGVNSLCLRGRKRHKLELGACSELYSCVSDKGENVAD